MDVFITGAGAAIVGIIGTIIGAVLANRAAHKRAKIQREHEQAERSRQLEHERVERRYEDKRSAYVNFALECRKAERAVREHVEQYGETPGEAGYDPEMKPLSESFELLDFVAADTVARAASRYMHAIYNGGFGDGSEIAISERKEELRLAVRVDLGYSLSDELLP